MNNQRRAALEKIVYELSDLQSQIETIKEAEQEAFDAMPESLQNSERGEKSQAAIDAMENAHDEIESARNSIDDAGA